MRSSLNHDQAYKSVVEKVKRTHFLHGGRYLNVLIKLYSAQLY